VVIQTTINQPGEPRVRAISALTMNIPEPIIEPITIEVESKRFNLLLKPDSLRFSGSFFNKTQEIRIQILLLQYIQKGF